MPNIRKMKYLPTMIMIMESPLLKYVLKYTTLLCIVIVYFNMHSISQLCGGFECIYLNKLQCHEKTEVNLTFISSPSTKPFTVLTGLYIPDQVVVGITINVL